MEEESLQEGCQKILFILLGSFVVSILIAIFFPHIGREQEMTDYIENNYPDLQIKDLGYFQIDSDVIKLECPKILAGKIRKPELLDLYFYSIGKKGMDSNYKGAFIVFDSVIYPCTDIPRNLFEQPDGPVQFEMENFVDIEEEGIEDQEIQMIFDSSLDS